jgi:hypothetical protein
VGHPDQLRDVQRYGVEAPSVWIEKRRDGYDTESDQPGSQGRLGSIRLDVRTNPLGRQQPCDQRWSHQDPTVEVGADSHQNGQGGSRPTPVAMCEQPHHGRNNEQGEQLRPQHEANSRAVHAERCQHQRGRRVEAVVSSIDILPTLLELCGAELPEEIDGRSLAPILRGASPGTPVPAFSLRQGRSRRQYSIRTETHHYLVDPDGRGGQLFHLASDPQEARDLAGGGSPKEAELRERVLSWAEQQNARGRIVSGRRASPIAEDVEAELRALGYLDPDPKPAPE